MVTRSVVPIRAVVARTNWRASLIQHPGSRKGAPGPRGMSQAPSDLGLLLHSCRTELPHIIVNH